MPWFGKKKESSGGKSAPSTNDSIHKLDDSLEVLQKREEVLNKKMTMEVAKAKEASKKGQKTQAMAHLKRKKTYESQMEKLQAQQLNLMTMKDRLEEAAMTKETLAAQQAGKQALSNAYGKMDADKVADEMDKIRDAMDDAREISDAMAQPLDGDMLDEDDLMDELNALEQEELDAEMLGINAQQSSLPAKKQTETAKPVEQQEEDDALAELEAQLA
eukprot:NODE_1344_length_898_cov_67.304799_g1298_i0.p1 GENE.NODE_1344_length_898_cov_67.304799_g1298_i0~~NODE_1344_length_898_cov_67.304799_g1298_i0.p1  ORF type:complete len:217 (+),score=73.37 NODE_1344_length_898_cov_67.304799_g1298_i0:139-789(+)